MTRAFRFRAEAAVDVRRREHDAARRQLARAESDVAAAEHVLADARCRLQQAHGEAVASVGDAARQQWYRSWIVRLRRECEAAEAAMSARVADAERARVACIRAKQRIESLERLREKALHSWESGARAEEQKQMDALATMRFVAGARESSAGRRP